MKLLNDAPSAVLPFFLVVLMLGTVGASAIKLEGGVMLCYRGIRIGTSGQPGYETWNASIEVLVLNAATLVFQSNSTGLTSNTNSEVTIKYQDGNPVYADYLTALIYLPPECIAQSVQGNLNWTTQIQTRTPSVVTGEAGQALNFTVEAGTFQSINITLALSGLDFGTLTFIYDVDSGILVFEEWVPSYGDIIVLSLLEARNAPETGRVILSLVLPAATLAVPAATAIDQTRRTLRTHDRRHKQQVENVTLGGGFLHKTFYVTLTGAMLSLTSAFLPWSQFADMQAYLPLSLPSAFAESARFYTSTFSFMTISLMVHAAAILAWLSVATHVYTRRKLTPHLFAIVSAVLSFISIIIFIQAGSTILWGQPVMAAGGILTVAGIIFSTQIHRLERATWTAT